MTIFKIIFVIAIWLVGIRIVLMDMSEIFRNDYISQKTKDKVSLFQAGTFLSLFLLTLLVCMMFD